VTSVGEIRRLINRHFSEKVFLLDQLLVFFLFIDAMDYRSKGVICLF
jgi:hypothetical protein